MKPALHLPDPALFRRALRLSLLTSTPTGGMAMVLCPICRKNSCKEIPAEDPQGLERNAEGLVRGFKCALCGSYRLSGRAPIGICTARNGR